MELDLSKVNHIGQINIATGNSKMTIVLVNSTTEKGDISIEHTLKHKDQINIFLHKKDDKTPST